MGGMIQGIGTAVLGTEQAADDTRSAVRQSELEVASATYNKRVALRKGSLEAQQLRQEGTQLIARQKVAYGNSGVATDSGTPLAVMADTRRTSELEALRRENDAAAEAWGYDVQRTQSIENKDAKVRAARRAQYGSILSGIGQFTGGAMSAGSMFGGGK